MIRILKCGEVSNEEIFARTEPAVDVEAIVADIIADVRQNGDSALFACERKFDRAELSTLLVSPEEIENARNAVEPEFLTILEKAAANQVEIELIIGK